METQPKQTRSSLRNKELQIRPEEYTDRTGFCIKILPLKGRCVFTTQDFKAGEFLLTYPGELIDKEEGEKREAEEETGFRYFFEHGGRKLCMDATQEPTHPSPRYGRLVNHGRGKNANCKMSIREVKGEPKLCLFAKKNIDRDVELLYDYRVPRKFKFPAPYYADLIQQMDNQTGAHNSVAENSFMESAVKTTNTDLMPRQNSTKDLDENGSTINTHRTKMLPQDKGEEVVVEGTHTSEENLRSVVAHNSDAENECKESAVNMTSTDFIPQQNNAKDLDENGSTINTQRTKMLPQDTGEEFVVEGTQTSEENLRSVVAHNSAAENACKESTVNITSTDFILQQHNTKDPDENMRSTIDTHRTKMLPQDKGEEFVVEGTHTSEENLRSVVAHNSAAENACKDSAVNMTSTDLMPRQNNTKDLDENMVTINTPRTKMLPQVTSEDNFRFVVEGTHTSEGNLRSVSAHNSVAENACIESTVNMTSTDFILQQHNTKDLVLDENMGSTIDTHRTKMLPQDKGEEIVVEGTHTSEENLRSVVAHNSAAENACKESAVNMTSTDLMPRQNNTKDLDENMVTINTPRTKMLPQVTSEDNFRFVVEGTHTSEGNFRSVEAHNSVAENACKESAVNMTSTDLILQQNSTKDLDENGSTIDTHRTKMLPQDKGEEFVVEGTHTSEGNLRYVVAHNSAAENKCKESAVNTTSTDLILQQNNTKDLDENMVSTIDTHRTNILPPIDTGEENLNMTMTSTDLMPQENNKDENSMNLPSVWMIVQDAKDLDENMVSTINTPRTKILPQDTGEENLRFVVEGTHTSEENLRSVVAICSETCSEICSEIKIDNATNSPSVQTMLQEAKELDENMGSTINTPRTKMLPRDTSEEECIKKQKSTQGTISWKEMIQQSSTQGSSITYQNSDCVMESDTESEVESDYFPVDVIGTGKRRISFKDTQLKKVCMEISNCSKTDGASSKEMTSYQTRLKTDKISRTVHIDADVAYALSDEDSDFQPNAEPNSSSESESQSEFEGFDFPTDVVTGKRKVKSQKSAVKKVCVETSLCSKAGNKVGKEMTPQVIMPLQMRSKHLKNTKARTKDYTSCKETPEANTKCTHGSTTCKESTQGNNSTKIMSLQTKSTDLKNTKISNNTKCLKDTEGSDMTDVHSEETYKKPYQLQNAEDTDTPSAYKEPCQLKDTKESESVIPSTYKDTEESDTSGVHNEETYKKPYRYCIFCKTMMSKLTGHIQTMHKDEERVREALKKPKKEKDLAFDSFRKEGILEVNKLRIRQNPDNPNMERERKRQTTEGLLVMCNVCKAFIERRYISRHEKKHILATEAACQVVPVPVSLFSHSGDLQGDYMKEVIAKFRKGEDGTVYELCTSDPILLQIGKKWWNKEKRKVDKRTEVRKSVMTDMRRIASVYSNMRKAEETLGEMPDKTGNLSDLFRRNNFRHLEEAVERYTTVESSEVSGTGIKAGLKLAVYYLLKAASKVLQGIYLIDDNDEGANDIVNWVVVLDLNKDLIFGDAQYNINKNREEKLRRPQQQPLEADIQKIRLYTIQQIDDLGSTSNELMNSHKYVELRDMLVCRLTLYNARRGGEPSRLKIRNWEEANEGVWLDQRHLTNLNPLDKALAKTLKIGYQTGKGNNHLVPILFPQDCIQGLRKVADSNVRQSCGIVEENHYLFPTLNGLEHVSGWHAVKKVCEKLHLQDTKRITATNNRHRVSTEFALMDVPLSDRNYIYKHLGHSEEVNQNVYQAPLAIKAITVVGRRLQDLDRGEQDEKQQDNEGQSDAGKVNPAMSASESAEPLNEQDEPLNEQDEPLNEQDEPLNEEQVELVSSNGYKNQQFEDDCVASTGRGYTHWDERSKKVVIEYFERFLMGQTKKKLPGLKEIKTFLQERPEFKIRDIKVIRSKVMNEKKKREKRVRELEASAST